MDGLNKKVMPHPMLRPKNIPVSQNSNEMLANLANAQQLLTKVRASVNGKKITNMQRYDSADLNSYMNTSNSIDNGVSINKTFVTSNGSQPRIMASSRTVNNGSVVPATNTSSDNIIANQKTSQYV